jgi:hypothetical protein
MSNLAYRYFAPCDEHAVLAVSCEYLAVTQAVQEDSQTQRTGVRYYTFIAPCNLNTPPNLLYEGDIQNEDYFYWMPSNAIDGDQIVAYTFSATGVNLESEVYPSIWWETLSQFGILGTANGTETTGLTFGGSENTSMNGLTPDGNQYWGE